MDREKADEPKAKRVCISTSQFPDSIRDQHSNDTYQCLLAVRDALEEVGIHDATNIIAGGMQIFVEPSQAEKIACVLLRFGITSVDTSTDREKIDRFGLDGAAAKAPLGFAARILSIIRGGAN